MQYNGYRPTIPSLVLNEAAPAFCFKLWVQSLVAVADCVENQLHLVSLVHHLEAGLDVVDTTSVYNVIVMIKTATASIVVFVYFLAHSI